METKDSPQKDSNTHPHLKIKTERTPHSYAPKSPETPDLDMELEFPKNSEEFKDSDMNTTSLNEGEAGNEFVNDTVNDTMKDADKEIDEIESNNANADESHNHDHSQGVETAPINESQDSIVEESMKNDSDVENIEKIENNSPKDLQIVANPISSTETTTQEMQKEIEDAVNTTNESTKDMTNESTKDVANETTSSDESGNVAKPISLPPVPTIKRFGDENQSIMHPTSQPSIQSAPQTASQSNDNQESSSNATEAPENSRNVTLNDDVSNMVHFHAIRMLLLMYPNIPKQGIIALYMSGESTDVGERLRMTMETLKVLQERLDGSTVNIAPPSNQVLELFSDVVYPTNESRESNSTQQQDSTDSTSKDSSGHSSWFQTLKSKVSLWKSGTTISSPNEVSVAENSENVFAENISPADVEVPRTSYQSWTNFFSNKLHNLHNPLATIEVKNNSERPIAISDSGPLDIVPIKSVAMIIRMVSEGTIFLQRASPGGIAHVKDRLGPGLLISFSLVPRNENDLFSGDGWCDIGFKLSTGLSSTYEYPRDFSVIRFPLHTIALLPYGGQYVYYLMKLLLV